MSIGLRGETVAGKQRLDVRVRVFRSARRAERKQRGQARAARTASDAKHTDLEHEVIKVTVADAQKVCDDAVPGGALDVRVNHFGSHAIGIRRVL